MTITTLTVPSISRSLRRSHSLSALTIAAISSSVGSICLAVFVAREPKSTLIASLASIAALVVLVWRFGLGVWIAILVLGSIDALPGPELETIEVHLIHLYVPDVLILVLIFTLIADNCRTGFRYLASDRARRLLCMWSMALMLLWLATVARSYVWKEIPLGHAMDFGRDFAFFAILLPLFAATLTRPYVRRVTLTALAIGIGVAEIAEVISVVTHAPLTFLVHPQRTTELNGITRLYINAQYLAVPAAMLSVGLLLFSGQRRLRVFGGLLALLSITSVALELTRAQYVGGSIGLATALAVWLMFNRRSSRLGRQRLRRLLVIFVLLGSLLILIHPSQISSHAFSGVAERFSSVLTSFSTSTASQSTLAYREIEASQLEQVLGSHWIFGLGFLDPRSHYVLGIRNGSIRNGDVGVLNAVMTMGVVGAILIYFPVVFILVGLVRRAMAGSELPEGSWIAFGIAAWSISVLTSSVTLVSLFSSPGLCIAALAVGIGVTCLTSANFEAARQSATRRRHGPLLRVAPSAS